MQAAPLPPPPMSATTATTAMPYLPQSLNPGPFILLLLLPSIPLLLFSLGARPPNPADLPFSPNDAWVTMGFMTVAGVVVCALGVWPEVGGDIWRWVSEGGAAEWEWGGWGGTRTGPGGGQMGGKRGLRGSQAVRGAQGLAAQRLPQVLYGPGGARIIRLPPPPPIPAHTAVLRQIFPFYSSSKPTLSTALVCIGLILLLLTVVAGQIIGKAYDYPSSSSSSRSKSTEKEGDNHKKLPSWVERELKYRAKEKGKPDETKKRVKKEEKEEEDKYKKKGEKSEDKKKRREKRGKEKEVLVKELERRGLELVGLEGIGKRSGSGPGKSGGKEKEKGKNGEEQKKEGDENKEKVKESAGGKVRKMLLGDKAKAKAKNKKQGQGELKDRGPGWEVADPALAQFTLANSEANASREAARLKAG